MEKPNHTRLRHISSKEPGVIELWLRNLGQRVQIYAITWDGKKHICWFVPGDTESDIPSVDLDEV